MEKSLGMSTGEKVTVALAILPLVVVVAKPIFRVLRAAFDKSVDFLGPLEVSNDGTSYLVDILGGSRDGGIVKVPYELMHDELSWSPDSHELYLLCHNSSVNQTKLVFSGYLPEYDHEE